MNWALFVTSCGGANNVDYFQTQMVNDWMNLQVLDYWGETVVCEHAYGSVHWLHWNKVTSCR